MKILAGLVLIALVGVCDASAGTVTVTDFCASGSTSGFSNPNPNNPLSSSWTCLGLGAAGAAVLPVPVSIPATVTSISGFIVYDSDYSTGMSPSVTEDTTFSISGFTGPESAAWLSDMVQTTGSSSSNSFVSVTQGATLQGGTFLNGQWVVAGFYDNLTGLSTTTANDQGFTVGYDNTFPVGHAQQGTGIAEVVYTFSTDPSPTPEPVTCGLVGVALIGLGVLRRKKA